MKSSIYALGEIAEITMGQSPPSDTYNTQKIGLPFFQGKAEFGEEHPIPVKWCSAPLRIAEAGDILLTVRAPVGPTNIASEKCCIGRGLASIRAKPEFALTRYLRFFFKYFEEEIASKGVGSTFTAINRSDIARLKITLPPLPDQERIVRLLDNAESLRTTRTRANVRMEQFVPALFQEMFGNVVKNEKNWNKKKFSELGQLDRGKSKHRPRDAAFLYGGSYPFVQTGDIANSNGQITSYSQTYSEEGLAQSKLWSVGTLCITIAANIGKTAILTFPACFPDSIVGFTPDNSLVDIEFIRQWLVTIESDLDAIAPQSAQKNINLGILRELPVPLPPLALQREFAARVEAARGVQSAQGKSAEKVEALYQSMLSRAFAGEL